MPLAPLWKTAKTTFENTTNQKKPTEKWVGNIRKSTGIESALKEVDGAKTASELNKALSKLGINITTYINLLDATAKDPKAVPTTEKGAYVTAITKLKTELEKIKVEGAKMETALEGSEKKDKVDPELIKKANDHIALREFAAAEAPKLAKAMRVYLDQITIAAVGAMKQLEAAKQAAKTSNTMLHQVAIGVIDKYIEQAEQIEAKAQKEYKTNIADGSMLMKARSDLSAVFDSLPESIKPGLKQKRDAPWKTVGLATAEMNSVVSQVETKFAQIKTARSQAEAAGNQLKDPQVYIQELTKLKAEIEKLNSDSHIKCDKIVKANAQVAEILKNTPVEQANWYRNQLGQWERYQPEISISITKLKSLDERAELPRGALENKPVADLVAAIHKAAKEGTDECNTALLAGASLKGRIELQSKRLQPK